MADDLARQIRAGVVRYAGLVDQASRTTERANVLHLIDGLELERGADVHTRVVEADELRRSASARGAAILHLDLVFRASVTAAQIEQTAARGLLRFAYHPGLDGFPIGVALALPAARMIRELDELFRADQPSLEECAVVVLYALAASPGRLGAGAALVRDLSADCRGLPAAPLRPGSAQAPLVAFSPLTGLRARVIRLVDDGRAWSRVAEQNPEIDARALRDQLLDLLAETRRPVDLPEPAASWLAAEARRFGQTDDYKVGLFHRTMGAKLVGFSETGDPADTDSLGVRAYFDYAAPDGNT